MVVALKEMRQRVSYVDWQLVAILALVIAIDCLYLHTVISFPVSITGLTPMKMTINPYILKIWTAQELLSNKLLSNNQTFNW